METLLYLQLMNRSIQFILLLILLYIHIYYILYVIKDTLLHVFIIFQI